MKEDAPTNNREVYSPERTRANMLREFEEILAQQEVQKESELAQKNFLDKDEEASFLEALSNAKKEIRARLCEKVKVEIDTLCTHRESLVEEHLKATDEAKIISEKKIAALEGIYEEEKKSIEAVEAKEISSEEKARYIEMIKESTQERINEKTQEIEREIDEAEKRCNDILDDYSGTMMYNEALIPLLNDYFSEYNEKLVEIYKEFDVKKRKK